MIPTARSSRSTASRRACRVPWSGWCSPAAPAHTSSTSARWWTSLPASSAGSSRLRLLLRGPLAQLEALHLSAERPRKLLDEVHVVRVLVAPQAFLAPTLELLDE